MWKRAGPEVEFSPASYAIHVTFISIHRPGDGPLNIRLEGRNEGKRGKDEKIERMTEWKESNRKRRENEKKKEKEKKTE